MGVGHPKHLAALCWLTMAHLLSGPALVAIEFPALFVGSPVVAVAAEWVLGCWMADSPRVQAAEWWSSVVHR